MIKSNCVICKNIIYSRFPCVIKKTCSKQCRDKLIKISMKKLRSEKSYIAIKKNKKQCEFKDCNDLTTTKYCAYHREFIRYRIKTYGTLEISCKYCSTKDNLFFRITKNKHKAYDNICCKCRNKTLKNFIDSGKKAIERRKGKKLEEIYNIEKANSIKEKAKDSYFKKGHKSWNDGIKCPELGDIRRNKKYEEMYSEEKIKIIKEQISKGNKNKKISNGHKLIMHNLYKDKNYYERFNDIKKVEKIKQQISESKIGEKNPMFNNYSSFEPYTKEFNKKLKIIIKERDGNKCYECGIKDKLIIHHIDYNKKNSDYYNLITLCVSCHAKTGVTKIRKLCKEHFLIYINELKSWDISLENNNFINYNVELKEET